MNAISAILPVGVSPVGSTPVGASSLGAAPAGVGPVAGVAPAGASAVAGVTSVGGLDQGVAVAPVAASASGANFSASLGTAVDQLQALQSKSQTLAVQAVTGQLENIHDYTIAAAEASTALQLAAAVRDRAVSAFQEIMRMQA